MAHYAQLDENNIVLQVIVISDTDCLDENGNESEKVGSDFCNTHIPGRWVKTSYNTSGGIHYTQTENYTIASEDQSKAFRKNFAGIGFVYDQERDAFIPPRPEGEFLLDGTTCLWVDVSPEAGAADPGD